MQGTAVDLLAPHAGFATQGSLRMVEQGHLKVGVVDGVEKVPVTVRIIQIPLGREQSVVSVGELRQESGRTNGGGAARKKPMLRKSKKRKSVGETRTAVLKALPVHPRHA